ARTPTARCRRGLPGSRALRDQRGARLRGAGPRPGHADRHAGQRLPPAGVRHRRRTGRPRRLGSRSVSGGRRAAVGIGAVVVVVAAAVAFLLWPRGTTEISGKDAVEDFREKKSTDTTATDGQGTGTPTPGVYTYSAEGQERVKLGPLPAQDRPLPATVTAVVTD